MLPLGTFAWRLCSRSDCKDTARLTGPVDRTQARKWLQAFTNDILRMGQMRALLARNGPSHVSEMSNDAVVDAIVSLLVNKRVHVHVDRRVIAAKLVVAPAPPPPPAPARRPPPGPAMGLRMAPVEAPTFLGDLGAQAATLVAAAASGAPFCPI